MILEDRTNAIISPTDNQKRVLTVIKASATPQVAASEISKGQNLLAARDMLVRLGLVKLENNGAFLTPEGEELLQNQNLTDESGSLTPDGEKYAFPEGKPQTESLLQSLNRTLT